MTTESASPANALELSDPGLIVEALEALQVWGLWGEMNGDIEAEEDREIAATGIGGTLRVVRARRAGYLARKGGLLAQDCPCEVRQDVDSTRVRAAWMSGWMLRELAERARPGEPMPAPLHLPESEYTKLERLPFFREFLQFGQAAAKHRLWARTWKEGARALFEALRTEPQDKGYQSAMRRKLATAMAESFLAAGGVNRVEWYTQFSDPRLGKMTLVLERVEGKSAGVLIAEATARAEAAERALAEHLADRDTPPSGTRDIRFS